MQIRSLQARAAAASMLFTNFEGKPPQIWEIKRVKILPLNMHLHFYTKPPTQTPLTAIPQNLTPAVSHRKHKSYHNWHYKHNSNFRISLPTQLLHFDFALHICNGWLWLWRRCCEIFEIPRRLLGGNQLQSECIENVAPRMQIRVSGTALIGIQCNFSLETFLWPLLDWNAKSLITMSLISNMIMYPGPLISKNTPNLI